MHDGCYIISRRSVKASKIHPRPSAELSAGKAPKQRQIGRATERQREIKAIAN